MTLNLQHPFTLIVAGPNSCVKSTFVIRLLEYREQLCDILFENIVRCHSENNAPNTWRTFYLLKAYPENIPTLIVLDDSMDFAYCTKANYLTKDRIIVTLVWF